MKEIIINSHNGYLQKYKSIFTDKYALKPYFLDENMEKRQGQPLFVKSGSSEDVYHMRHAIISDGMAHSRQLAMLRSCSGYQLRSESNNIDYTYQTFLTVIFRNQTLLTAVTSLPTKEKNNKKCRHLHHQDTFSKVDF